MYAWQVSFAIAVLRFARGICMTDCGLPHPLVLRLHRVTRHPRLPHHSTIPNTSVLSNAKIATRDLLQNRTFSRTFPSIQLREQYASPTRKLCAQEKFILRGEVSDTQPCCDHKVQNRTSSFCPLRTTVIYYFCPLRTGRRGLPRSPRAPRPSSLSALRVCCCVLGSPESYRTDARRGGLMRHVKL